jgi:hypothetical protein
VRGHQLWEEESVVNNIYGHDDLNGITFSSRGSYDITTMGGTKLVQCILCFQKPQRLEIGDYSEEDVQILVIF